MPLYEYECKQCGEKFEVRRGIFQAHKPKCPKCSSENANRVFSAANKGSSTCGPSRDVPFRFG